MRMVLSASAVLATAACASPAERISGTLADAGLDAARAECVGLRLEGDLSLGQLGQLADAAKAYRSDDSSPGRLTLSDLIRVAAQIRDPEVPIAVAKAAAACA